ncbi:MAG: hypothetical protein ACOYT7_02315 [Patescibacteria group bacterium]
MLYYLLADTMIANIFVNSLGVVVFLFIFWKKLKEDYVANVIFTTAFYMLVGVILGFFASRRFLPPAWFWLELLGLSLGLLLGIVRYKLRVFETVEAASVSLLPWLGLFYLTDAIANSSVYSFLAFFAVTCLVTLFFYLDAHYRNFSWYKSGRVGFSGLTTLGAFFLLRALIALPFPFVISFIGRNEAVVSGVGAFFAFLTVYNLARKT